jgi:acyl carrier protein
MDPHIDEDQGKEIVAHQAGEEVSDLKLTTKFADIGDSLKGVEIRMSIEENFNIEIPDSDAEKIKTIADLITYLKKAVK